MVRTNNGRLTDGVHATTGAGVAANGASRSGGGLGRGISDEVSGSCATTLESVVKPDPVTDFVSEGLSAIIVRGRSSGEARIEENYVKFPVFNVEAKGMKELDLPTPSSLGALL